MFDDRGPDVNLDLDSITVCGGREIATVKIGFSTGQINSGEPNWPRHFSNTMALVALGMDSAAMNVLARKLGMLLQLQCMESVNLVQEYRSLEEEFGIAFTNSLLSKGEDHVLKSEMMEATEAGLDYMLLKKCSGHRGHTLRGELDGNIFGRPLWPWNSKLYSPLTGWLARLIRSSIISRGRSRNGPPPLLDCSL